MTENFDISLKNDTDLVKLSLENQDNFLYLIKRYQTKLFRYIQRLTNISKEDTEDLLQEVFLKVYLKLNDFDQDLKFSSWIYRITHNEVISNYRRLKARPQSLYLDPDDNLIKNIISELDVENEVEKSILKENIMKILNQLERKYKDVLVLKFLEEKNYQEISDILQKPMGTIGTLINKGKKLFKEELIKQNIKF